MTGGSFSGIYGSLLGPSDLSIYLLNPQGILFGSSSVVNVGGLVAGSLDISDSDFLTGSPDNFIGMGLSGVSVASGASVTSAGPLVLLGGFVDTSGNLSAGGNVVIAAASDVTVSLADDSPISITISQGTPISGGVVAGGTVGGSNVYLALATRSGVMDALLDVSGIVTATSATVTDRGIVLSAGTSANGITVASGGDTSGTAPASISGSLDSAMAVEIRTAGSISGTGTVDAASHVHASANGLALGAVTAGTDVVLVSEASGIGQGSQDLNLAAGRNISLNGGARGVDIALSAGGAITTGSITARDDAVVRAAGAISTGAVPTGATIDALAPAEVSSASDALVGRTLAGHTIRIFGSGAVVGPVRAGGAGSDIVLNGQGGGIGNGSSDLDLVAGGRIILGSSARGRDISLSAGGNVFTGSLTARDDVAVRSPGVIRAGSVTTGTTVDGLGAVDVTAAADSLVGASLTGNDVTMVSNRVNVRPIRAIGSGSDIALDGGSHGIGYYYWDLNLQGDGSVVLSSIARGQDVAIVAGGQASVEKVYSRDDIFISGSEVVYGSLTPGIRAVDVNGAADTAAGTTLEGHQVVVR